MVSMSRDRRLDGVVSPAAALLWERLSREAEPLPALSLGALGEGYFRLGGWWLSRLGLPGAAVHFALRKRHVESCVRRELEAGASQVVVLGAGLDPLSVVLAAEYPERSFVELDHPATQGSRIRALQPEIDASRNLHLLALDLSEGSLEQALLDDPRLGSSYDPEARTVFLAEGLFMYLEPPDVEAVLAFVARRSGPESLLLFSFLERHEDGRIGFERPTPWLDLWLHGKGEPFRWGVSRSELAPYLAARGLTLEELAGRSLLTNHLPAGVKVALPTGERLAAARRI
jgi:methyltransferase (TIGR00027 family)